MPPPNSISTATSEGIIALQAARRSAAAAAASGQRSNQGLGGPPPKLIDVPYGQVQGLADGFIPAYSNGNENHFSGERNFTEPDGVFTGFRYQCVEFARRWLLERRGVMLPDIPTAADIFDLGTSVEYRDAQTGEPVTDIVLHRNGGQVRPELGALLIFPKAPELGANWGHIGVIVGVQESSIMIADQNQHFHDWNKIGYSAELKIVRDEVKAAYNLVDHHGNDEWLPIGWITFPSCPLRNSESPPLVIHDRFKNAQAHMVKKISLNRITFKPTGGMKANWLDRNDPAESKFIDTFGMDVSRSRLDESEVNYYEGNFELLLTAQAAANHCHAMFVAATAKVLASDDLMKLFGIPQVFWDRVRRSFAKQRAAITGRFDFAVSEAGELKTFEYNADSAATLLECGRIQSRFADAIGIGDRGRSAAFRMDHMLKVAWEKSGVKGLIHFCVDNDDEEQYTALYAMQQAEKVTGIKTRLCIGFDDFAFDDHNVIHDKSGNKVRTIWKTWAWETAFTDYAKAIEDRGPGPFYGRPRDKVRLCDLVLGDESIRIFEPLWKVIPSNKAILPIVWNDNKNSPYLLRAEYEISDELRAKGYAKKPIVGRTGQNITISDDTGATVKESVGKFSDREWVYQELFQLQKRDDYYAILGAWVIGEEASGVGIREDKTVITGSESPFSALRYVPDDD